MRGPANTDIGRSGRAKPQGVSGDGGRAFFHHGPHSGEGVLHEESLARLPVDGVGSAGRMLQLQADGSPVVRNLTALQGLADHSVRLGPPVHPAPYTRVGDRTSLWSRQVDSDAGRRDPLQRHPDNATLQLAEGDEDQQPAPDGQLVGAYAIEGGDNPEGEGVPELERHYRDYFLSLAPGERKAAWMRLLLRHHPDKHATEPAEIRSAHEEHFKAANLAYKWVLARDEQQDAEEPDAEVPELEGTLALDAAPGMSAIEGPAPYPRRALLLINAITRDLGLMPAPPLLHTISLCSATAPERALIYRACEVQVPHLAITPALVRCLLGCPVPFLDVAFGALRSGRSELEVLNAAGCANGDVNLLGELFRSAGAALLNPLQPSECRFIRRVFTEFQRPPTALLLGVLMAVRGVPVAAGVLYYACQQQVPDGRIGLPGIMKLVPHYPRLSAEDEFLRRVMGLLRRFGDAIAAYEGFDFREDQLDLAEQAGRAAEATEREAGRGRVDTEKNKAESSLRDHAKDELTRKQKKELDRIHDPQQAAGYQPLVNKMNELRQEFMRDRGDFGAGEIEVRAGEAGAREFESLRSFFASPAIGNDEDAAAIFALAQGNRLLTARLLAACRAAPGLRALVRNAVITAVQLDSAVQVFGGATGCSTAIAALTPECVKIFATRNCLPALATLYPTVPVPRIQEVGHRIGRFASLLAPAPCPHLVTLLSAMDVAPCLQLLEACPVNFGDTEALQLPHLAAIHGAALHGDLLNFLGYLSPLNISVGVVVAALTGLAGRTVRQLKKAVFARMEADIAPIVLNDYNEVPNDVFLRWLQIVSLRIDEGIYALELRRDWINLTFGSTRERRIRVNTTGVPPVMIAELVVHLHPGAKGPTAGNAYASKLHAKPTRGDAQTPHGYATDNTYSGFWAAYRTL